MFLTVKGVCPVTGRSQEGAKRRQTAVGAAKRSCRLSAFIRGSCHTTADVVPPPLVHDIYIVK